MSGHQCDHQCSHSATDFTQDLDELDFEKSLCGRVSALNIQEVQRFIFIFLFLFQISSIYY